MPPHHPSFMLYLRKSTITCKQVILPFEGGVFMKYVLFSLAECSKLDLSGSEKLSKSDRLLCLYVKGKKTLSAKLKEAFAEIPAEIEYYEIASASELWLHMAYLIGMHTQARHDVYVITADKEKLPGKIAKEVKVYSSFKSVSGSAAGTSSKKTTAKKTSASSAGKTSAKKTSTAKKSTATKKSAASKKKDSTPDVADLITKQLSNLAGQLFK